MFKISKGLGNLAAATLGFYRQIGVEEVQVPARFNTNINMRPLVPPTQKKAAGPMPPAWDEDELQRICDQFAFVFRLRIVRGVQAVEFSRAH